MTEEILLKVDVESDSGDFQKLSQLESQLIDNKKAIKDIADEFKKGQITQKEYADQVVKLKTNQKELNAQFTETQKKITGLKSPFDKLNDSIKEQAKSVTVAGVSLSTFANPVTATIAVLGGLFKAYASSTTGAKDLEFAQNQLSAATGLLSEEFAKLISSSEDGEGFFSGLLDDVLFRLSPALAGASKGLALIQEQLEDAQREEIKARGDNSERLEENAELLTKIGQEQTSYNDKILYQEQITENLKKNQDAIVAAKQAELKLVTDLANAKPADEARETAKLNAEKDLNRERARAERLIQASMRAEDNIRDNEAKRLQAIKDQNEELKRQGEIYKILNPGKTERDAASKGIGGVSSAIGADVAAGSEIAPFDPIAAQAASTAMLTKATEKQTESQKKATDASKKDTDAKQRQQVQMLALSAGLGQAAAQFEETTLAYKGIAITKATIDTYLGATSALTLGPIIGPILAALMIGLGLANVAQIAAAATGGLVGSLPGFAGGGLSGTRVMNSHGKPIKRANGDNRLVTVKTNEVILNEQQQMALGGDATFRGIGVPGFASGGLNSFLPRATTNQPIQLNQALVNRLIRAVETQKIVIPVENVTALQNQQAEIKERATI